MQNPTNGELGLMIRDVAKDVVEIKEQTTKTNGRVTLLEKAWNMAIGGFIITNIIIVPIAIALAVGYLKK